MPVSFIVASLLAAFTLFSFAELSARFPLGAGEAVYLHEAFAARRISLTTGLCVVFAGLVSCATISRGFVGYLHQFAAVPDGLAIVLLVFPPPAVFFASGAIMLALAGVAGYIPRSLGRDRRKH